MLPRIRPLMICCSRISIALLRSCRDLPDLDGLGPRLPRPGIFAGHSGLVNPHEPTSKKPAKLLMGGFVCEAIVATGSAAKNGAAAGVYPRERPFSAAFSSD